MPPGPAGRSCSLAWALPGEPAASIGLLHVLKEGPMKFSRHRLLAAAGAAAVAIAGGLAVRRPAAVAQNASIAATPALSRSEALHIADQGVTSAGTVQSLLRRVGTSTVPTRMHVAVVDRLGRVLTF